MATHLEELYEADFFTWTRRHVAELRRLARTRPNLPLDLKHLIAEVEDLGKSERDAVRSQLRRIILHCLKLEYSRAVDPRGEWRDSVIDARAVLADKLSRSLRRDTAGHLAVLYRQARARAANQLASHAEMDSAASLPETCPYKLGQLLDEQWYPPSRHGIGDRM